MNELTAKMYASTERIQILDAKPQDLEKWVTNACGAWTLLRATTPGERTELNFEIDCPRSGTLHYQQVWMPPLAQMVFPTCDDHASIYETADRLATAVNEAYSELSCRVLGNFDRLQQFWGAMTAQERRELLKRVWKDIPIHRRPDFAAAWSRTSSESMKEFLCPAINMEDLTKGTHLIDLIKSRALHPPWTFSRQDYEAAKVGITNKKITGFGLVGTPSLVVCMDIEAYDFFEMTRRAMKGLVDGFEDFVDPTFTYGKVYTRAKLRKTLEWVLPSEVERCRIENAFWTTQPALITLRIQRAIYSFVGGCVELLQNRCCSMLPFVQASVSQKQPLQAETHESIWSTLLSDAPYHAPKRPDFTLLLDFLNSKRTHAEDHVLELRRSPLYFTETVAEYNSNDSRITYMAPPLKPNAHPVPRAKGQPRLRSRIHRTSKSNLPDIGPHDWNKVIQDVQYDAYLEFAAWRGLEELLTRVRSHFDTIQQCIEKNELVRGVQSIVRDHYQLDWAIKAAWRDCVRKIKPARRADFEDSRLFHYIDQDNRTKVHLSPKQKVDYLLYQLCPDEVDDGKGGKTEDWHEAVDTSLGLHTVADFLDTEVRRLIETDSPCRFGAYHARVLSDLVMIAEIDRQLRTYDDFFLSGMIRNYFVRIKDNVYDNEDLLQYKADIRIELSKGVPCIQEVRKDIMHAKEQKLEHDPDAIRYFRHFTRPKYPEDAAPTYANVTLMVAGEKQLDRIWKTWTKHVEQHVAQKKGPQVSLHRCVGVNIENIPRTTPMVEPEAQLNAIPINAPKEVPQPENLSFIWSFSTLRDTVSKKDLMAHRSPKEKRKSRGIACGAAQQGTPNQFGERVAEQLAGPATITLKDPHFTTIRALWTNEQLKDVVWKDFLRAMATMGFGLQKLGGSSWLFTPPPEFGFRNSVYMHEPHPSKSMYPAQAFWKGRALTRRYGWDKNTFVQAL